MWIIWLTIIGLIVWIIYEYATAPMCDQDGIPLTGLQPVGFPEQNELVGEGSTVYKPLPALVRDNLKGEVITCWELTIAQRITLLFTGRLWASTWTLGNAFQPLFFSTQKADILSPATGEVEQ
ncbi:MAG: hypothetical protein EOO85_03720 [Pedobacter sp.]|nr:MAG: hypothetical protein EOO85_03720 [Pedobacter sp.]